MTLRLDSKRDEVWQRAGEIRLDVRWNVIEPQDLLQVLSRSIARALAENGFDLGRSRIERVRRGAVALFLGGIRRRARRIRALPKRAFLQELDRTRDRLLVQCDDARAELRRLESRVGHLRTELPAPQPIEPERDRALDAELEIELRGLFRRHGWSRRRSAGLEDATVGLMIALARRQRWGMLKERLSVHRSQIDVLARRIDKLNEALRRTEGALEELVRIKSIDEAGVASIYRSVQGLSSADSHYRAKREMLREIFEANVALQSPTAA